MEVSPLDLLKYANENNAVEFGKTFEALLAQKSVDLVDELRQEIGAAIFDPETEEVEETEGASDE